MAKLSLLEIVQDVMSDMSSDAVTSVGDTAESERVAAIAKSTFFKMIEERNWPHLGNAVQLHPSSNVLLPTHMSIPANIRRLEWVKYDKRVNNTSPVAMRDVVYKHPKEFLEHLNSRNSQAANITVVTDPSGAVLNIRNDVAPEYWTSFDDISIVFDNYNSVLDTVLQQSKTQCFGYREPVWGGVFSVHATSTTYALGDVMAVVDAVSGLPYYYKCTVAGITAAVSPSYPTVVGATIIDGTTSFLVAGKSSQDSFVPDLPAQYFPMYLAQVKAQCFNKIKQVVDSQEERDAKRQRIIMQTEQHKNRQDGQKQKYGYGRK